MPFAEFSPRMVLEKSVLLVGGRIRFRPGTVEDVLRTLDHALGSAPTGLVELHAVWPLTRPHRAGEQLRRAAGLIHGRSGDVGLWVRRVHDHAVTDVHRDVADRAVVEQDVAGLQLADRDTGALSACALDE